MITINLLNRYGAVLVEYAPKENIFKENELPLFYYQILEGSIKMYNFYEDGKEYTQGYFNKGQSFGEPPLLLNKKYPASAIALEKTRIYKLSKNNFMILLEENPEVQFNFLILLAQRVYNKSYISKEIINQKPEIRIRAFLDTCKVTPEKEKISYTRQEIANFTGLRVETVIRTILKMKKNRLLDIINHKIYY
nr:Crp/Fnr family transcriptional regulator [uncultured Flavobacterium sp.]